jgi:GntR family transcriptional regulator
MVRAEERLRAVLPTEEQAQTLQLPMGTPLLQVERLAYTYHDQPMEVRQGLYLTEHHHYRNELN